MIGGVARLEGYLGHRVNRVSLVVRRRRRLAHTFIVVPSRLSGQQSHEGEEPRIAPLPSRWANGISGRREYACGPILAMPAGGWRHLSPKESETPIELGTADFAPKADFALGRFWSAAGKKNMRTDRSAHPRGLSASVEYQKCTAGIRPQHVPARIAHLPTERRRGSGRAVLRSARYQDLRDARWPFPIAVWAIPFWLLPASSGN